MCIKWHQSIWPRHCCWMVTSAEYISTFCILRAWWICVTCLYNLFVFVMQRGLCSQAWHCNQWGRCAWFNTPKYARKMSLHSHAVIIYSCLVFLIMLLKHKGNRAMNYGEAVVHYLEHIEKWQWTGRCTMHIVFSYWKQKYSVATVSIY